MPNQKMNELQSNQQKILLGGGVKRIEKQHENINGIRIAFCSIDSPKITEFVNRINLALEDF